MYKLRILILILFFSIDVVHSQLSKETYTPNLGIEKAKNANDTIKIYIQNIKYYASRDLNTSIIWFNKTLSVNKQNLNTKLIAEAYSRLADAYWFNNQFDFATEYYLKAQQIGVKLNDKQIIGNSLYNLGWIKCFQLKDTSQVKLFYNAINIFEELKDTGCIIQLYSALASYYKDQFKVYKNGLDSSQMYYFKVLNFVETTKFKENRLGVYINMSGFFSDKNQIDSSRKYIYKAINILNQKKILDAYSYTAVYSGYLVTLNHKDSLKKIPIILNLLNNYWKDPITVNARAETYQALYKIYKNHKMYENAFNYLFAFKNLSDTLKDLAFNQNILHKENQFVLEKKDKALKELSLQNQITSSKNRLNKFIIYGLGFFAVVVLIGLYFLFKSNKSKQKSNELLEEKNKIISEKKLEIDQSIKYAKGIQSALLPTHEEINKVLENSFIYYLPKDVVSGDFYWFQQLSADEILLACADCTGHGVPGSLMSIVSIDKLNLSLFENKLTNPKDILFNINNQIKNAIKQQKDGLDITLIKYNIKTKTIYYSGANRNLWLVRNSVLIEYKATKNCIAGHTPLNTVYNQEEIKLEPNDFIVLSTDGYADQFGGGKGDGKKMMTKRFKEVVVAASQLPINDAENLISNNYKNWMGKFEQVDDVCVIGFRV
ncbi:MAG: SpoIIE family protein phosphatase [Bacteroidetes bacterium]|nr:SpoIIE family protein phosphatase [Bacteroidota bacterium]